MEIIKKYLTNGQYFGDSFSKTSIFLHHTVSTTANSAWRWWNSTPDRVGTAYIIDRDGTIIECFDPSHWAYHLGIKGDDDFHEKHGVGIELVSTGPVYFENGKFMFYPLYPNKTQGTIIPKEEVVRYPDKWRGYEYFQDYTTMQIQALGGLLKYMYERFPEINTNIATENWYQYNDKVVKNHLGGIWAHTTVVAGKSDIHPSENLLKLIKDFDMVVNKKEVKSSKKSKS